MSKIISLIATAAFCAASSFAYANDVSFESWLRDFRQEARNAGISESTLSSLDGISEIDRVIELDRKQPESTVTFEQYIAKVINQTRINKAQELYDEHRDMLNRIGKKYGVQPRFIVALWGIESNFGGNMGGFNPIDALATLAYDGRRSEYFRGELLAALRIIDAGNTSYDEMKGSWAGALGQCQFMPSTFLHYAVDEDGDGRKDIWETQEDVFASIANYLRAIGWNDSETWGRAVSMHGALSSELLDIKKTKTLSEWSALGVTKRNGEALPEKVVHASLIGVNKNNQKPLYLVYGNYKVLLKWNRSRYFATAVGTLADSIEERE